MIAEGIIVGWPGSPAAIPEGWSRVTDLDGLYPRGVLNAGTDPGDTGGSATHSHSTPGHSHSISHSHSTSSSTGGASSTVNRSTGSSTDAYYPGSHTHSRPSTHTRSLSSDDTSPGTSSTPNDPVHETYVWIESDGTPEQFPAGCVTLTGQAIPTGWTPRPGDRFIKGAAPGSSGGTVSGGSTSHSHTINSHSHGGASHNHTSGRTGLRSSSITGWSGSASIPLSLSHNHSISVHSASAASLHSSSGGSSGTSNAQLPPYLRLSAITAGTDRPLSPGLITLWLRPLADIPQGWRLCDGTGGTPDLRSRFVRTATDAGQHGQSGGSSSGHTHSGGSHSHNTSSHNHSSSTGASSTNSGDAGTFSPTASVASANHTHSLSKTNSTTPSVGSNDAGTLSSASTLPPYRRVAFIMLVQPGDNPPDAPVLHPRSDFDAGIPVSFSWTFVDPDLPLDGQSAYELQVLDESSTVVYDTGKVTSTDTTALLPADTLTNGQTYQWRVKTWDQDDNEGPYSTLSTFHTLAPLGSGRYNPTAPLVIGQEWAPIRDEPFHPSTELERGYSFLASEAWPLVEARAYVDTPPAGETIAHAPVISIYPMGMEAMTGPVRRVVAPVQGSSVVSGSVVFTNVPSDQPYEALLNPGDGSYLTMSDVPGGTSAGTLRLGFDVGNTGDPASIAGALVGKRILAVNLLYHAFGTLEQVNASEDRQLRVSLRRLNQPKWTYIDRVLEGTTAPSTAAPISRLQLGNINPFNAPVSLGGINPQDNPVRLPFNAPAVGWFSPGAGASDRISVDIDWAGFINDAEEEILDSVSLDYAALEIVYCEETRAAVGAINVGLGPNGPSSLTGRAMRSYERGQPVSAPLIDAQQFADGTYAVPTLLRGIWYTITVALGTGSMSTDLPTLRALRQISPVRGHAGIELRQRLTPGATFTRTIVDVLPQLSMHTATGVIPDSHVYGVLDPGVVLSELTGPGGPVEQGILDLADVAGPYPQVRFWARRRGEVPAPLVLRNLAEPQVSVSLAAGAFDALPEIVDGWREVTMRFDPPPPEFTGANAAAGAAGATEYTTPGADNYIVPAGVTRVMAECWGGGGPGYHEGVSGSTSAGGGGGYARSILAVTPLASIPVFVGAGGTNPGVDGQNSTFDTNQVIGEGGGAAPATSTEGLGGSGTGQVVHAGGDGGLRYSGAATGGGGGGGGSGSATAPGGTGSDGSPAFGGLGGAGEGAGGRGGEVGASGLDGVYPGGGGGGRGSGNGSALGGDGADGRVRVTPMPATAWQWRIDAGSADAQWEILAAATATAGLDPATYGGAAAHMVSDGVQHLDADATLMFSRDMPPVTGLTVEVATQPLAVVDPDCPTPAPIPTGLLYHHIGWDPLLFGPEVALFGAFQLQRQDDTMDTDQWETIAVAISPFAAGFDDYEARISVESRYRIRGCNHQRFCGPWSGVVASTLPNPGVTGVGMWPVLTFTSNENPARNLAYVPGYTGSAAEPVTYVEAEELELRRHYDRNYQTAYRPTERGGEQFTRTLVVNTVTIPVETLRAGFTGLRDLAWADLPYVCVRDERADRWLANINVPDSVVRRPLRTLYMATVAITEVTATPAPVEVDACEGLTSSTDNLPDQAVWAYTPHIDAVEFTGAFTIEAELRLPDWDLPDGQRFLVLQKYDAAAQIGVTFLIEGAAPVLRVADDAANTVEATGTERLPFGVAERGWVRVQFDPSGSTTTFSYSSDGVSWTQLGAPVAAAAVTGNFDADAATTVGGITIEPGQAVIANNGTIVQLRVRGDATGGPLVASPDFGAQPPHTTDFTDSQQVRWAVTGNGTCSVLFGGIV